MLLNAVDYAKTSQVRQVVVCDYDPGVRCKRGSCHATVVAAFSIICDPLTLHYYMSQIPLQAGKDHLGTIKMTVDAKGASVSCDDYYAFGMVMPGRSSNSGLADSKYKLRHPFYEIYAAEIPPLAGFTGKERDVETSLDYFGARYYPDRIEFGRDPSDDSWRVEDPALRGRQWLSVDPMASSFPSISSYSYGMNSPVCFVDLHGDSAEVITDKESKKITFVNDGKSKKTGKDGKLVDDEPETKSWDVRTEVWKGHKEIEGGKDGKYADDLTPINIEKSEAFGPGEGTYIDTERPDGKDLHGGGTGLKDPYADKQGWVRTYGCQRMQNVDIRQLSKLIKEYKKNHPGEKVPGYIKKK